MFKPDAFTFRHFQKNPAFWRFTCAAFLSLFASHVVAQDAGRQLVAANAFSTTLGAVQVNQAFARFGQSLVSATPARPFRIKMVDPFPASSAFDGVSTGSIQMMWAASANFVPKEYAFTLLSHPPFISLERYLQWRSEPSTFTAVDALYSKHGMKALPCTVIDSGLDFVLRRVPVGDYQFRGAKIGMFGPLREIYAGAGIIPIAMPYSEIVRGMETGVIDGAYAISPHESIELRLYESTKAVVFPSTIRGYLVVDLMMNLAFWNSLDASDRTAIEGVCRRLVSETVASSRKLAGDAIERYRKAGILIMTLPEPETQAIRQKWDEVAAKRAAFEPVFEQLYKSLYAK